VGGAGSGRRALLSKVPEITVSFWVTKILTTAMGEATSDYAVYHMNRYLAVVAATALLAVTLVAQLAARRYVAWVYWLVVVMVAVFGTMVADAVHIVLGVPYVVSTPAFAIILAAVFVAWFLCERDLSIHHIRTTRREMFYWATVLATFALGTAAGDMTATSLHLGYLVSAVVFGALFALPLVGRAVLGWNEVFAFWFAYVMTRPFGASVADFLGMSPRVGGLGIDKLYVSAVLTACIAAFVVVLTRSRVDVQAEPDGAPAPRGAARR